MALIGTNGVSGYFYIETEKQNNQLRKEIKEYNKEINKLNKKNLTNMETIEDQKDDLVLKDAKIKDLQNEVNDLKWREKKEAINTASYTVIKCNTSVINATAEEIDLMARLVEAEAGIEPYKGKVAVAQVVLNRVKDHRYPNTIKGVIYQPHQYESVSLGMLWDRPIKEDSKRAVQDALNGANVIGNCISFWADYLDPSHSLWDLPIKFKIGRHVFTDAY